MSLVAKSAAAAPSRVHRRHRPLVAARAIVSAPRAEGRRAGAPERRPLVRTGEDGSECRGATSHLDSPRRLLLAWHISAAWAFDPSCETEVEVRFREAGPGRTGWSWSTASSRPSATGPEAIEAMFDGLQHLVGVLAFCKRSRRRPERRGSSFFAPCRRRTSLCRPSAGRRSSDCAVGRVRTVEHLLAYDEQLEGDREPHRGRPDRSRSCASAAPKAAWRRACRRVPQAECDPKLGADERHVDAGVEWACRRLHPRHLSAVARAFEGVEHAMQREVVQLRHLSSTSSPWLSSVSPE